MMLRGDARKRLNPEPLPHWAPDVVALIEKARAEEREKADALIVAARDQGRVEGFNAGWNARMNERQTTETDSRCWECGSSAATRRHPEGVEAGRGCDDCFPDWPRILRLIDAAEVTP